MPIAILAAPIAPSAAKAADVSPAAEAGGSVTAGDFAALLGQMASSAGIPDAPSIALVADATTKDDSSGQPQDAALLLAAMGLGALRNLDPAQPSVEDGTGLPGNSAKAARSDAALSALQEAPGQNGQEATAAGQKTGAETLTDRLKLETPTAGSSGETNAAKVTSEEASPAKLAGFEHKLADALAVNREQAPAAPQATAAPGHTVASHADTQHLRIDTPVREQTWPTDFGQKIVWLATQDKQSAQITLNPPQLGPIEISLNLKSDVATAVFASGNPDVREAIESAIPRLREMLAGVGVELGQANVSAESFRQANTNGNDGRNGGDERGGRNGGGGSGIAVQSGAERTVAVRRGNGLVDTFA